MTEEKVNQLISLFENERFSLEQFLKRIVNFFQDNPVLHCGSLHAVHSIKYRTKSLPRLREKIIKKSEESEITAENLFNRITDLVGVRILHLYSKQLIDIHTEIMKQVDKEELILFEQPIAYTWDIDSTVSFQTLGLRTEIKPSYYTSVHYVVMPKERSKIKCEIQVRTLFEEVWGEIDHSMNYPHSCDSVACKEQIKVLAQLAATGKRLADSIMESKIEFDSFK